MNFRPLALFTAVGIVVMANASPTEAFAQAATAQAPAVLKTGNEVLARYTQVTGGTENYKSIKSLLQEGELSIPAAGIQGTMTFKLSGDDKFVTVAEIPSAGMREASGILGETGWSDSPTTGTRLVEGKELDQLKGGLDMRQYYEPEAFYDEILLIEEPEEVDGDECYVVRMTRASGEVSYGYFSKESGLKVKSKTKAETPAGAMDIEAFFSDYKEFSGVLHATKMVQKLPNGMEIVITFTKIEPNVEFPEDTFDLPESVKKLVEKKKSKESEKKAE